MLWTSILFLSAPLCVQRLFHHTLCFLFRELKWLETRTEKAFDRSRHVPPSLTHNSDRARYVMSSNYNNNTVDIYRIIISIFFRVSLVFHVFQLLFFLCFSSCESLFSVPLRFGGMSEFLRSRRDGVEMRSDGDHFSVDLAGDISSVPRLDAKLAIMVIVW